MGPNPGAQGPSSEPHTKVLADLLCRSLVEDAVEAGRLACWGPLEENWGARDNAFTLGMFSAMDSGVLGTQGLQVKADVNSLGEKTKNKTKPKMHSLESQLLNKKSELSSGGAHL